eukprot:gnl/TRDRNA2_/TRDRNA2_158500_c0_seq3.p1 gnl/TRDRNA2_/TRDRNA2_158500_c0~~gnl/TRDRNA2_/TRDRNA2_158500_c0_seq3.p1  ORF type:complete len:336 (-),score=32.71 gnl/TRDRNA2_/TRDRNA2_158500_c0_seq3:161-1168(-)
MYTHDISMKVTKRLLILLTVAPFIDGLMVTQKSTRVGTEMCQDQSYRKSNSSSTRLFIAINVGAKPEFIERRMEVRASWMQHQMCRPGGPLKILFYIGGENLTANNSRVLDEEQAKYGDILRLPVQDGYRNLNKKTVALLHWFARELPAPYLMKLDDDSFPHLDKLMEMLNKHEMYSHVYMGQITHCTPDHCSVEGGRAALPTYAQGAAYILSAPLVQGIVSHYDSAMKKFSTCEYEDAMVGFFVNTSQSFAKVWYVPVPSTSFGCEETDIITMTQAKGNLLCMENKRVVPAVQGNNICCNRTTFGVRAPGGDRNWCDGALSKPSSNKSLPIPFE